MDWGRGVDGWTRGADGRMHYQRRLVHTHSREYRFSIILFAAAAAFTASVAAPAAFAAENYSTWGRSADLILDTSPSGANVTGTVTDFPVLVRLTSSNFNFAEARGRGQDIRFSGTDGTPMDYQIERWDSTGAKAEVWVRIASIAGNAAGQAYKMHWGKASAADSSDGAAVFSRNQVGVWHLGGPGYLVRPNSVAGGQVATPVNYNGDEFKTGIIGYADSLDGDSPGDYLDLGDGYQDFSQGFSFSVWAYPTAVKSYARFFELGNGESADNIMLFRDSTSNNLRFDNYNPGATVSTVRSGAAISLNQWQLFGVTVAGGAVKIYKNGAVIASSTLSNTMSGNLRTSNFLGKSNWAWDAYFQGKLDQPEIHNRARSDSWMKLAYENQKTAQSLVSLKLPSACVSRFSGPADMEADEGAQVNLTGIADCASGYSWSAVSGPAPRIMDPDAKTLTVALPRVTGDTVIVYRFTAVYGDSAPYREVRLSVREAIPDPVFTLPAGIAWNGKDSISFRPVISNLSAILASRDSAIHWSWTVSGLEADTAWLKDGLRLRSAAAEGKLEVGLCLDNSGSKVCKTATVTVSRTAGGTSPILTAPERSSGQGRMVWRDVSGRLRLRPGIKATRPSNLFGTAAKPIP
jgi:hypothetical protein